ncbi:MAG: penicillin-binding transpeptidase domain-containing protein, partial [Rhizobiaceae bacterium]
SREAQRVAKLPLSARRRPAPRLASHLSQQARDRDPTVLVHRTLLDAPLQQKMEALARQAASRIAPRASVAIVIADSHSGAILASVGSAGIGSEARRGWIDMTQAPRSPGSTLKPFVYGLAIEDGLVRPASMIMDSPADFSGYRPTNFDLTYQGSVSIRRALQMSLNVPAVKLIDAVGPSRLVARMKRAGVTTRLPQNSRAGLGLVLGGTSLSLTELVQLYANLVSTAGRPLAIGDGIRSQPGLMNGRPILSPVSAWHIRDMLAGLRPPNGARALSIGYKTGTSYGHRDAWSVGFDGRHVIGVWVGRADNGPVPGITGTKTAAPILFEAFARSGLKIEPMPPAPAGALRETVLELPTPLRLFEEKRHRARFSNIHREDALEIAFPTHGDQLELAEFADGSKAPIVIKLQGGVPPFRLLENQNPLPEIHRQRKLLWSPSSRGTSRLSVVDSLGQSQALDVVIR